LDNNTLIQYIQPYIGWVGNHPYIKAIIILGLAFALASVISFIIAILIGRLTRRTATTVDDEIVRNLRMPLYWSVIQVGALAALAILNIPENTTAIVRGMILSLLITIWSVFTIRLLRILIKTASARAGVHAVIRPQTLPLFNNIVVVVVLALAVYLIFQIWNIDMTAWLASAGIIGIAVGFAAKDTLANLFAGVFILADTPYKIDDYVVLESGERGKVTHIGIRSTRILTRDDVEITIPNSIMGNTRVINESGGPYEKFRVRVPVGVAYGSDVDLVRKVLLDVAREASDVSDTPEPRVRFRRFGNSSLDFELLVWVHNPELRGRAVDVLNTAIYKRFMQEKIEIPYSKHDIYIKEMPKG